MTISMNVFSEMYEDVAKKLLDKNQYCGRGFKETKKSLKIGRVTFFLTL